MDAASRANSFEAAGIQLATGPTQQRDSKSPGSDKVGDRPVSRRSHGAQAAANRLRVSRLRRSVGRGPRTSVPSECSDEEVEQVHDASRPLSRSELRAATKIRRGFDGVSSWLRPCRNRRVSQLEGSSESKALGLDARGAFEHLAPAVDESARGGAPGSASWPVLTSSPAVSSLTCHDRRSQMVKDPQPVLAHAESSSVFRSSRGA